MCLNNHFSKSASAILLLLLLLVLLLCYTRSITLNHLRGGGLHTPDTLGSADQINAALPNYNLLKGEKKDGCSVVVWVCQAEGQNVVILITNLPQSGPGFLFPPIQDSAIQLSHPQRSAPLLWEYRLTVASGLLFWHTPSVKLVPVVARGGGAAPRSPD